MEFWQVIFIVVGGLVSGFLGSLMGLGGGIVAIPFLNIVVGVPMNVASASGLISTVSTSCGASGRHICHEGMVDVPSALRIQLATAAGALLGGVLAGCLGGGMLQVLFAVMLVYGGFHIVRLAYHQEPAKMPKRASSGSGWKRRLGDLLFFAAGVVAGALGIGGGLMVVPLLHLFWEVPFKNSTATSNFMMGPTAIPALLVFVARGDLDIPVAASLAGGVLLGANLGSWLMPKVRTRYLQLLFVLVLLAAAVQMAKKGIASW